jgi:hypothetical protein
VHGENSIAGNSDSKEECELVEEKKDARESGLFLTKIPLFLSFINHQHNLSLLEQTKLQSCTYYIHWKYPSFAK